MEHVTVSRARGNERCAYGTSLSEVPQTEATHGAVAVVYIVARARIVVMLQHVVAFVL